MRRREQDQKQKEMRMWKILHQENMNQLLMVII